MRFDECVRLHGPVSPAQVDYLCTRGAALLRSSGSDRTLVCVVTDRVDLSVIGAVARLLLMARRQGGRLDVRAHGKTGDALAGLLAITGLGAVNGLTRELEAGGQAEPSE